MTRRPAEVLTGAIGSVLALLIAFGINLSDDQTAAILALVAWVPAIITACVELWRARTAPTVGDALAAKLDRVLRPPDIDREQGPPTV